MSNQASQPTIAKFPSLRPICKISTVLICDLSLDKTVYPTTTVPLSMYKQNRYKQSPSSQQVPGTHSLSPKTQTHYQTSTCTCFPTNEMPSKNQILPNPTLHPTPRQLPAVKTLAPSPSSHIFSPYPTPPHVGHDRTGQTDRAAGLLSGSEVNGRPHHGISCRRPCLLFLFL